MEFKGLRVGLHFLFILFLKELRKKDSKDNDICIFILFFRK